MPYLAVADGFHTVYYHLRETFHRQELGIKTDNLHLLPPIYLAVFTSTTMRRRDDHIFHAARHHLAEILASVLQQGEGRIEEKSRYIVLQSAHRLGIGEAMQQLISRALSMLLLYACPVWDIGQIE